ncbi:sensor domain-containing diguanylate cyclase [Bradymonas sediminis]|uniref:sensor domain-containing protein n=1 Tax=Bradymonas sediminis TaxID=1548548 RepID=UPI0019551500|nr:sensor domain-containing diguanylate cyclase [Bradymonas sediminis]
MKQAYQNESSRRNATQQHHTKLSWRVDGVSISNYYTGIVGFTLHNKQYGIVVNSEFFPKVLDLLLDTVCVLDEEGRFIYASASCLDTFGYTREELNQRLFIELVHPEDLERTLQAASEDWVDKPGVHFENRYIRKDGSIVDIMWSGRWLKSEQLRIAVARDVTSLKRAQRKQAALYQISEAGQGSDGLPVLCEQIHAIVSELLSAQNFSLVLYDREREMISVPYSAGEVVSAERPQRVTPGSPIARVLAARSPVFMTVQVDSGEGQVAGAREWLGVPLLTSGAVIGALVVQGEVDTREYTKEDQELLQFVSAQIAAAIERKQAETHLRYMAGHDPLTDLPNRNLFHDRLTVAVNRAKRDNEHLALLYLDLNDFKQINDTLGHEAGDQVLREVAKRLSGCLRESDTVARIGGDEFTALLPNCQGERCLPLMINRIRDALRPPFEAGDQHLTLSASIGAAVYPEHGQNYNQLLRHADQRMYVDKARKPSASLY